MGGGFTLVQLRPKVDKYGSIGKDFLMIEKINANNSILRMDFEAKTHTDKYNSIDKFYIKKLAFVGKKKQIAKNVYIEHPTLTLISNYNNYFINYYDTDDELALAYVKVKYIIDTSSEYPFSLFKKHIVKYFMTDSILKKIEQMTEDNFDTSLYASKNKGDNNESLKFTNEHCKMLMSISTMYKILSPIVSHYLYKSSISDIDETIYKIFLYVLIKMSKNVQMYSKLYIFIQSRLKRNQDVDRILYKKFEEEAITQTYLLDQFLYKLIIEGIIKYRFDGNLIHFNTAFIKKQLSYNLKRKKLQWDYKTATHDKADVDDLSGADKIEMALTKIDEGKIIKIHQNIEDVLKKLMKISGIREFDEEEVVFYMQYIEIEKHIQMKWISHFFSNYINPFEFQLVTRRQYMKFLIIFKKMMSSYNFKVLQYVLSSNLEYEKTRKKRIAKKLEIKIKTSEIYQNILYKYRGILDEEEIYGDIVKIVSYKYILFDYFMEQYDVELEVEKEKIIMEFLRFLEMI